MGGHGGQLLLRTHRLAKGPGATWVQMEVKDTGCGISPADLERIFDPFYTTKHESQEREGTGLARFHSLTRQELAQLLFASGAMQISVHSAFDDQAYLAVAEKPLR